MCLKLVPSLQSVTKGLGTIHSASRRRYIQSRNLPGISKNSLLSSVIGKKVIPLDSEFYLKHSKINRKKKYYYQLKGGGCPKRAGDLKLILNNRIFSRGCCSARWSIKKVSKERIDLVRPFSTRTLASEGVTKCKLDSKQIAAYQSAINKLIANVYQKEQNLYKFTEATSQPLLSKKMLNSFSKVWNRLSDTIPPVKSSSEIGFPLRKPPIVHSKQKSHSVSSSKLFCQNETPGMKYGTSETSPGIPLKKGLYKYIIENNQPSPLPRMNSTSTSNNHLNAKSVSEYVGGRSLEDSNYYEDRVMSDEVKNKTTVKLNKSNPTVSNLNKKELPSTIEANRRTVARNVGTPVKRVHNSNSPLHDLGHSASPIENRMSTKPLHMLEIPPTLQQLMKYKPVQLRAHVKAPSHGNILQAFGRRVSIKEIDINKPQEIESHEKTNLIDITERLRVKADMEMRKKMFDKQKRIELLESMNLKKRIEERNAEKQPRSVIKKEQDQEVYVVNVEEPKTPEVSVVGKKSRAGDAIEQLRVLPSIVRSERSKKMSQSAEFEALKKKKYEEYAQRLILAKMSGNTETKLLSKDNYKVINQNIGNTISEQQEFEDRRFKVSDKGNMSTTSFKQRLENVRSAGPSTQEVDTSIRRKPLDNKEYGVQEIPGTSHLNIPLTEEYVQASAVPISGEQNVRYVYRVPSSTRVGRRQQQRRHSSHVHSANVTNIDNETQTRQSIQEVHSQKNKIINQQSQTNASRESATKVRSLDNEIPNNNPSSKTILNNITTKTSSNRETDKILNSASDLLKSRVPQFDGEEMSLENLLKSKALNEASKKNWRPKGRQELRMVEGSKNINLNTLKLDQNSNIMENNSQRPKITSHFSQNFKTDDTLGKGYPSKLQSFLGFHYIPSQTISTLSKHKPRRYSMPQPKRHFSTSTNYQNVSKPKGNTTDLQYELNKETNATFLNYSFEALGTFIFNQIKKQVSKIVSPINWICKSIVNIQCDQSSNQNILEALNSQAPTFYSPKQRLLPHELILNDKRHLRSRYISTTASTQTCDPTFLKDYQRSLDDDKLPSERMRLITGKKKKKVKKSPLPEPETKVKVSHIKRRRSCIYGAKKHEENTTADKKMRAYGRVKVTEVGKSQNQEEILDKLSNNLLNEQIEESPIRSVFSRAKNYQLKKDENDNVLPDAFQNNRRLDFIVEANRRMKRDSFSRRENSASTKDEKELKKRKATLRNSISEAIMKNLNTQNRQDDSGSHQQNLTLRNHQSVCLLNFKQSLNQNEAKSDPMQVCKEQKNAENQIPTVSSSSGGIKSVKNVMASKCDMNQTKAGHLSNSDNRNNFSEAHNRNENSQDIGGRAKNMEEGVPFIKVAVTESVDVNEKEITDETKLVQSKTEDNNCEKSMSQVNNASEAIPPTENAVRCEQKLSESMPLGQSKTISNIQNLDDCKTIFKETHSLHSNLNQERRQRNKSLDGTDNNVRYSGLDGKCSTPNTSINIVDKTKRSSERHKILKCRKNQVEEKIQPRNYMAALNKSYECKRSEKDKRENANSSKRSVIHSLLNPSTSEERSVNDQRQMKPLETQKEENFCEYFSSNVDTNLGRTPDNVSSPKTYYKNGTVVKNSDSIVYIHRRGTEAKGEPEKNYSKSEALKPSDESSTVQKERPKGF